MVQTNKKVIDNIKTIIIAILAYFIVSNTVSISKVYGNSMIPTIKNNSYLFINKAVYKFKKPKIGDVVIVKYKNSYLVKRIIALENDSIEINNGVVYVNEKPLLEVYSVGRPENMKRTVVPKNHLFLIGDNRENGESFDSRNPKLGPVNKDLVVGKVVFSIYPFYKIMYPLNLSY
ncbi:signal peptidase I [Caloramator sp. mosi_1]|uniref:signal peptidase I n=1 Tax=Caloramator sp. mosi_1 TaxID=3023090 RepID=UPI00235EF149|nr:signal peptidase I [Caloramator sp. mosi_1]WDC84800.1 signal peptidase I [Caloramator sp. mosi_1]